MLYEKLSFKLGKINATIAQKNEELRIQKAIVFDKHYDRKLDKDKRKTKPIQKSGRGKKKRGGKKKKKDGIDFNKAVILKNPYEAVQAPDRPIALPERDELPKHLEDLVHVNDPRELFFNLVQIGDGTFGVVYCGMDIRSLHKVAIKQLSLATAYEDELIAEIFMMKQLSQENIVQYIETYKWADQLWVVMEYMDGGSVTDILEIFSFMRLSEGQIAYIMREVHSLYF